MRTIKIETKMYEDKTQKIKKLITENKREMENIRNVYKFYGEVYLQ